jgi:hypothetical protein
MVYSADVWKELYFGAQEELLLTRAKLALAEQAVAEANVRCAEVTARQQSNELRISRLESLLLPNR